VDLESARIEILVNGISKNSNSSTQMVVLPVLPAKPVDVK